MTRDNITRMTLEANGRITSFINYDFGEEVALFYLEELERFAALVAAAEREACAAVCERLPETFKIAADEFGYQAEMPTAENYAAAIRARGET